VDIDVAAVFCNNDGHVIGAVDGEHDSLFGVMHSGDSVAADGTPGDDEAITIDLAKIPEKVSRIFIVLTITNGTFELIESAYARVLDQHSSELVRFDIEANAAYRGLLVAQLFRSEGAELRWGFQGLGRFFTCPSCWKSMAHEIIRVAADTKAAVDPAAMRRQNKTRSLHKSGSGSAGLLEVRTSDGEAKDTDCMACGGAGCSMCRASAPEPQAPEKPVLKRQPTYDSQRAVGAKIVTPTPSAFGSNNSSTRSQNFQLLGVEPNGFQVDVFNSQCLGRGRLRISRSATFASAEKVDTTAGPLLRKAVKPAAHVIELLLPTTHDDVDKLNLKREEVSDSLVETVCR